MNASTHQTSKHDFMNILNHDKEIFDEPEDWQIKGLNESPLIQLPIYLEAVKRTIILNYQPFPTAKFPMKKISNNFNKLIKLLQVVT